MPGSVGSRAPVVVLVAAAILAGAPGEAAAQGTARDVAASREAGEQLAALRARVIAAREALPGLGGEERDAAWRALSGAAAWSRAVALQPGAPAAEEGAESRRAAERRVAAELSPHLYAVERAEVVVDSLARLAGDSDPLVRAATVESAALLPDGAGLAVLRSRLLALAAPWLPSAGERPALGLGLATPSRRPGSAREESEDGLAGARPRPTMEQAKEFRALAEGFGRVGGPETIGPLLFLLRDLPDPAANETAARQLRTLRFDAPGDEDAIRAAEAGLSPAGGDLSAHLVARRTMLLTRAQALAAAGDHERRVEAARHLAIFGPGEPARTAAALAAAGARNPGGAGVEPGTGNPGETGGVGEASEVERARALLTRAEPNRDLMRRLADDPHPAVRRQAMEALGWWGLADDARVIADRFVGDARRRLADGRERLAAFPEPDPETRVTAARAVAAIGDDAGAPALFFLLDNGGDRARIEAARALARMRFPAAPELRAVLPPRAGAPPAREAGALARMEVCRALGQIGHDNADAVRGPLIAALEDEDPGVARNAAEALVRAEDRARLLVTPTLGALVAMLHRPDRATAASLALEGLTGRAFGPSPPLWGGWLARLARAFDEAAFGHGLGSGPDSPAPPLRDEPTARLAAARALGEAGGRAAAPVLGEMIESASLRAERVDAARRAAAVATEANARRRALVPGAPPQAPVAAHEPLFPVETDARVLGAAVTAYGSTPPSEPEVARRLLSDRLGPSTPAAVRVRAALAIGHLELREAAGTLVEALADEAGDVRAAAAAGLFLLGERRAANRIEVLLTDPEPEARAAACRVLGGFGEYESARAMFSRLWDADPRVVNAAAEGMGRVAAGRLAAGEIDRWHALCRLLAERIDERAETVRKGAHRALLFARPSEAAALGVDFGEDRSRWFQWIDATQRAARALAPRAG